MKQENVIAIGAIFASTLVGLMGLFVSTPPESHVSWLLFHAPLVLTLVYGCLHIGSAILFLRSLDAYKSELRRVYIAISIGIAVLAIGTLQVAIIAAFNWWNTPWAMDGYIVVPFLVAGMIVYIGARGLGKLISIKSLLVRSSAVLPSVFITSLLVVFIPHPTPTTTLVAYNASNIITTWTMLMFLAAGLTFVAIARHIGEHYKSTMRWLSWGFLTSTIVLASVVGHTLVVPNATNDFFTIVTDLIGVIAGLIYLRAAYEFAKTKDL